MIISAVAEKASEKFSAHSMIKRLHEPGRAGSAFRPRAGTARHPPAEEQRGTSASRHTRPTQSQRPERRAGTTKLPAENAGVNL